MQYTCIYLEAHIPKQSFTIRSKKWVLLISYLLTLVLIHGLLLSRFSYMGNASDQAASVLSIDKIPYNDLSYKLKLVSRRDSSSPQPPPASNIPIYQISPPPQPSLPPSLL